MNFRLFSETAGDRSKSKATEHSEKLSKTHLKSFIYVGEWSRVKNFKSNLRRNNRDFDVLHGSPGIL